MKLVFLLLACCCAFASVLVSAGSAGTYSVWIPETTFLSGETLVLNPHLSDDVTNDGVAINFQCLQGDLSPTTIVFYPDHTQSQPLTILPSNRATFAEITWSQVTLPLCSLNDLEPLNVAVEFSPPTNGDDSYVAAVYSGTVDLGAATSNAISISFWAKRKSIGGTRSGVLSHGSFDAGGIMWVGFEGTEGNNFGIGTNDNTPFAPVDTAYTSTDFWTYFTVQIDNNQNGGAGITSLWINGELRKDQASGFTLHDSATLTVGCSVNSDATARGGCADIMLDSLRIYNTYLSSTQIADAFLRNVYSNVISPKVFYAMDTDGTNLLDSSGNNNNLGHVVVPDTTAPIHDFLAATCSLANRTPDPNTWASGTTTLDKDFGNPNSGGVTQDPRFVGFRGQEYQVHGIPNQFYALFSTPALHFNALFSYLPFKPCDKKQFEQVQCVSHDGTYLTAFGFLTHTSKGKRDSKRDLVSGPIASLKVAVPTGSAKGLQVSYQDAEGHSQSLSVNTTHVFEMTRGVFVEKAIFDKRRQQAAMGAFEKSLTARSEALTSATGDSFNASSHLLSTQEARNRVMKDGMAAFASPISHPYGHHVWIEFSSPSEVTLHTSSAVARLVLADGFINHEVSLSNLQDYIRAEELAAEEVAMGESASEVDVFSLPGAVAHAEENGVSSLVPRIHGLLGQTVLSKRYNNKWRFIQGDVADYVVSDLFALDFNYAVFSNATQTPHL